MILISLFISAFLTGLFFIVLWNLWVFRMRKYDGIPENELPFVSVLIPARNEEKNIRQCAESILKQDYPHYEVIILDDNSEDSTIKILSELSLRYDNLKVIKGLELPEGWSGKNFACHQLYKQSHGDYLLFTDADTVHRNDSLSKAVTRSVSRNADLYTLIPEMTLKSFSEKFIMPGLHFTAFSLLPYYLAENYSNPAFAMAAGPFMLFKRKSYVKIGGHEAVSNELVEDVKLAKNIKKHKLKVVVNKGLDVLSCRMYDSFGDIWSGFSKNIFPGMNYSSAMLFSVFGFYLLLFFVPFVALAAGIISGNYYLALNSAYQTILILIMRLLINLSFRLNFISILLHPVSIFIISLIAFNSWKWNVLGKGSKWKGRTYSGIQHNKNEIKSISGNGG